MTDHATLRRMCDAQADIPSADVMELLDAIERVRALAEAWRLSGFDKTYEFSFDLFRALDVLDAMPADCDARGAEGAVSDAGGESALGDTPTNERPADGIVSAAHYGRVGA